MGRFADAVKIDSRPYVRCKIATLRATLDAEDLEDLDSVLADKSFPGSAIARQIGVVFGVQLGPDAVLRHRRGECACGTPD